MFVNIVWNFINIYTLQVTKMHFSMETIILWIFYLKGTHYFSECIHEVYMGKLL